jgi:hypothetical protein
LLDVFEQMDNPHGPVRITAVAFAGAASAPHQVVCATSSVDGTVKVWR